MIDYKKIIKEHFCKTNQGCGGAATCMCALAEDMADEIDRLRDALLEIKYMPIRKSQPPWSIHAEYFHIARAALEGKE